MNIFLHGEIDFLIYSMSFLIWESWYQISLSNSNQSAGELYWVQDPKKNEEKKQPPLLMFIIQYKINTIIRVSCQVLMVQIRELTIKSIAMMLHFLNEILTKNPNHQCLQAIVINIEFRMPAISRPSTSKKLYSGPDILQSYLFFFNNLSGW